MVDWQLKVRMVKPGPFLYRHFLFKVLLPIFACFVACAQALEGRGRRGEKGWPHALVRHAMLPLLLSRIFLPCIATAFSYGMINGERKITCRANLCMFPSHDGKEMLKTWFQVTDRPWLKDRGSGTYCAFKHCNQLAEILNFSVGVTHTHSNVSPNTRIQNCYVIPS